MKQPKLVGINEHYTYSNEALQVIEALEVEEQKKLSAGLAKIYSDSLAALFRIQTQSFVHRSEVNMLNLMHNQSTLLVVESYSIKVEICTDTFHWHVVAVESGALEKGYDIQKII